MKRRLTFWCRKTGREGPVIAACVFNYVMWLPEKNEANTSASGWSIDFFYSSNCSRLLLLHNSYSNHLSNRSSLKKITKVAWTRHWRQTYTSERTADDTNTTAGYPPSIPPGWRARLWGNLYARQSRQKFIMYTEQRNSIEVWRLYLFCFSPKHLGMSPHASEAKMTSPCQCITNTRWEKRYTALLFKKNNRKQIK